MYRTALIDYIQDCVDAMGIRGFNVIEICFVDGFWSWDDTEDEDGNILDSMKVITKWDLQKLCNHYGIEDKNGNVVDCINF